MRSNIPKKLSLSTIRSNSIHLLNRWEKEEGYQDYVEIIPALMSYIRKAKKSIDLELYIFTLDKIGNKIFDALKEASKRGVKVRMIVDGVGSPNFNFKILKDSFINHNIQIRVYKPRSLFFKNVFYQLLKFKWIEISKSFFNMNHRNHRKSFVIDGKTAFLGSANLDQDFSLWREFMVAVEGPDVKYISNDFNHIWFKSSTLKAYIAPRSRFKKRPLLTSIRLLNRWKFVQTRRQLINQAKDVIQIINPYFIPPMLLLIPLLKAARRGVKVELLTSGVPDICFVGWFSRNYYNLLIKRKIIVYEHPKVFIHSKVIIIDNQAIVGSSNYNYRSFNLDLELDVLLSQPKTINKIKQGFIKDINESKLIKPILNSSLWKKFLTKLNPLKKIS